MTAHISYITADPTVTKYCVKCGHRIPGMRLSKNVQCWCGEWMYPYTMSKDDVIMVMDCI